MLVPSQHVLHFSYLLTLLPQYLLYRRHKKRGADEADRRERKRRKEGGTSNSVTQNKQAHYRTYVRRLAFHTNERLTAFYVTPCLNETNSLTHPFFVFALLWLWRHLLVHVCRRSLSSVARRDMNVRWRRGRRRRRRHLISRMWHHGNVANRNRVVIRQPAVHIYVVGRSIMSRGEK